MVRIPGTSSFLIDAFNFVEQERACRQPRMLNEIIFLMEDEQGDLIEVAWLEKFQNLMEQPPFYFG